MNDLQQLANLVDARNQNECEITALICRPAAIGHLGEHIASRVFNIQLQESAAHKGNDGYFLDEPLKDQTVNIKWYAFDEGLLEITPEFLPGYYLVLAGMKSGADSSSGRARPWTIEKVYLFDAQSLMIELDKTGVKVGIATSVRGHLWNEAEIYPADYNNLLHLSQDQRESLALFRMKEEDYLRGLIIKENHG